MGSLVADVDLTLQKYQIQIRTLLRQSSPELIFEQLGKKYCGQALFCVREVSLALEAKGARLC